MKFCRRIIKCIIPNQLWFYVRKRLIIIKHHLVACKLRPLIKKYNEGLIETQIHEKKIDLPQSAIIWQYWAQGFDCNLPEIVRICLDSVTKHASGYRIN